MLREMGPIEPESRDADSQIRQFHRTEFLLAEDVNVLRPRFLVIRRSREIRVVVPRRDEDSNGPEAGELLDEKRRGVRSDAVVLEEVPRDQNEVNRLAFRVVENTPEGSPDRLSLSVPYL